MNKPSLGDEVKVQVIPPIGTLKLLKNWTLVIAAGLLVGGCEDDLKELNCTDNNDLINTSWELASMETVLGGLKYSDYFLVNESMEGYTLEFIDDSLFTGVLSCNRIWGRYESGEYNFITIGDEVITTLKGCPKGNKAYEYFEMLRAITSYCFADGNLRLSNKINGNMLKYTPFIRALGSTRWVLKYIKTSDNDTIRVDPAEDYFTILFKDDFTIEGVMDCNHFGGEYTLGDKNTLTIQITWITEVYCGEESLDATVITATREAKSYSITGNKLEISFGTEGGILIYTVT